jgi:RimJ/RimL family protein N-acetyltransferase
MDVTQKETHRMTSAVPIVGLRESDRPYLQMHFLCLGREDRRLRFGAGVASQSIRDYVARIDFVRDRLFAVQGEEGSLAAVAHIVVSGDTAEIGLSVVAGARRRGFGTALLARAIDHLRNLGVRRAFMHCLAENHAMMRIARNAGARIETYGAENEAWLCLAPATSDSFHREWLDEPLGGFVALTRQWLIAASPRRAPGPTTARSARSTK